MSSSTRISRRRDGGRSEAEAGLARRVAAEAMPLSGGLAAVAGSAASASDRGAKSGDELGGLVASGFGVLGHVGVDPVADGAVAELDVVVAVLEGVTGFLVGPDMGRDVGGCHGRFLSVGWEVGSRAAAGPGPSGAARSRRGLVPAVTHMGVSGGITVALDIFVVISRRPRLGGRGRRAARPVAAPRCRRGW